MYHTIRALLSYLLFRKDWIRIKLTSKNKRFSRTIYRQLTCQPISHIKMRGEKNGKTLQQMRLVSQISIIPFKISPDLLKDPWQHIIITWLNVTSEALLGVTTVQPLRAYWWDNFSKLRIHSRLLHRRSIVYSFSPTRIALGRYPFRWPSSFDTSDWLCRTEVRDRLVDLQCRQGFDFSVSRR